jgi:hypothetical protein
MGCKRCSRSEDVSLEAVRLHVSLVLTLIFIFSLGSLAYPLALGTTTRKLFWLIPSHISSQSVKTLFSLAASDLEYAVNFTKGVSRLGISYKLLFFTENSIRVGSYRT